MLLDNIDSPADLQHLDADELRQLASEIRAVLIDAVAANGGHLGSNLGAVELTLALHRVFDSPRDALVWDTGHQAYVHKLVTGRREGLRAAPPGRRDVGLPVPRRVGARRRREQPRLDRAQLRVRARGRARHSATDPDAHVVAVIGDGALTGGLAYEALNNLGHSGRRVVVDPERQRPLLCAHGVAPHRVERARR